jgi:hypothetical protein
MKAGIKIMEASAGSHKASSQPMEMRIHKGGAQKLPATIHALSQVWRQKKENGR